MNMELPFIEAVVGELQQRVSGAAIRKVYQPGSAQIVLHLWTGRENLQLLFSCATGAVRLHLTVRTFVNPPSPPRFCQLLRARFSRLHRVERLPGERVVLLHGSGGDGRPVTLVAELFPPQANLLLLDATGCIIDLLLRRDEGPRPLLPGLPYTPPVTSPGSDLDHHLPRCPTPGDPAAWLKTLIPMPPLISADLMAGAASGLPIDDLVQAYCELWRQRTFSPLIAQWRGRRVLSAFAPAFLDLGELHRDASPSVVADLYYGVPENESFIDARLLKDRIVREVERLQRRLTQLASEAMRWQETDRDQQCGDLLLANLHLIRPRATSVIVTDWFADPPAPREIPLDPMLSPQQNAERYYARRRKARRAAEHLQRRRDETVGELDWLANLQLAVAEATTPAELAALHDQLGIAGLLQRRQQAVRQLKRPEGDGGLRVTVSPGGYRLIWGKHPAGNDEVSRRLTAADDLWFHAHDRPGCHLVLKRDGRKGEIPHEDQRFAAALAAGYSHSKDDSRVEVMVCRGDQVNKPKGARPGAVTVVHYTTLIVQPRRLDEG